jgi:Ser/Thr protein kinase RdoA (MazF antagonist)
VGEARWREVVDAAHRAGRPWAGKVEALVPEMVAAEPLLDAPRPRLQRCHLDFNLDNVLLDADGRVVVIDWENSGPAVPEQEVAFCLVEWDDPAFVAGYRAAGGDFTARDVGVFALRFAVEAHLLELFVRRALDPATADEDRMRAEQAVADKLRAPLTLRRAERLLAAVP